MREPEVDLCVRLQGETDFGGMEVAAGNGTIKARGAVLESPCAKEGVETLIAPIAWICVTAGMIVRQSEPGFPRGIKGVADGGMAEPGKVFESWPRRGES